MSLTVGEVRHLEEIAIDLPIDEILDRPPFPTWMDSRHAAGKLRDAVAEVRPAVLAEIEPRGMYRILETDDSGIAAYEPPELLLDAEYVCSVVVTVGELSDEEDEAPQLFEGFVRDAVENVALTVITETVGDEIRDVAEKNGWNTTRLFTPGDGGYDWPLSNRRYVFETLPTDEIGVSLLDNGLNVPNKTISGVVGMGSSVTQVPGFHSCLGCPILQECDYADTSDLAPVTN
ncbi:hypothetical protein AArcCO_0877 [Halalkaliarchaeum sp. AArc-CO]|uniref:hypothetical protein n=1 Tax=Halalkaliarchaeum sp. AArc-CO TaxID=2866381 RepID=UPI00217E8992|nr:hypothetical protein [Halalkaliarchaeum sp. AArc-CO]UWG50195.1 hypothetical protein AArcCO_0877 [Halalkaliarchaeum sp. AArc-CO]